MIFDLHNKCVTHPTVSASTTVTNMCTVTAILSTKQAPGCCIMNVFPISSSVQVVAYLNLSHYHRRISLVYFNTTEQTSCNHAAFALYMSIPHQMFTNRHVIAPYVYKPTVAAWGTTTFSDFYYSNIKYYQ